MNLYMRDVSFSVGNKSFSGNDFTIFFDVSFDSDSNPNICNITIYNLLDKTINEIKKGMPLVLNAGYVGDSGSILLGEIKEVQTKWQNTTDKTTTISVLDGNGDWLSLPIKKTYKPGITAKQVLTDILRSTGLAIGAFNLPVNKIYKGGKTINSKLSTAIAAIAKDCGAKTHVNRGKIFIRPQNEGDNIGFVLDAAHGLVNIPTPATKDIDTGKKDKDGNPIKQTINGWSITSLLNHRITTDALIELHSKTGNGIFKVDSGKHTCDESNFTTEMEVYPV